MYKETIRFTDVNIGIGCQNYKISSINNYPTRSVLKIHIKLNLSSQQISIFDIKGNVGVRNVSQATLKQSEI